MEHLPKGRLIASGFEVSFSLEEVITARDFLSSKGIDFSSCTTQAEIIVKAANNGYGNLGKVMAL